MAQRSYQCGPAALASVFRYWGKEADADVIASELYKPGTRGVLDFMLSSYARQKGFWTQTLGFEDTERGLAELKQWIERKMPPIVLLKTGVLWVPAYHYVVLKGFDGDGVFYANVGDENTSAIDEKQLSSRWKATDGWALIVCPPERVDWTLTREQRFDLAGVFLAAKQHVRAEGIYRSLLAEDPAETSAANNLAWSYLEQGLNAEAVQVIETAFKNGAARRPDILDTLEKATRGVSA